MILAEVAAQLLVGLLRGGEFFLHRRDGLLRGCIRRGLLLRELLALASLLDLRALRLERGLQLDDFFLGAELTSLYGMPRRIWSMDFLSGPRHPRPVRVCEGATR